jgi:hypothetical protein
MLNAGGGGYACGGVTWAPGGFCWRLLVGKGAQKARGAPARELSKAVFWILRTDSSYREVEPYLVPLGQASSGAYVAGG